MATKKYLDQAGLKTLIQGLKAKNDALYAAKGHAHTPDQLVYVNAHMSAAATVKDALDILATNVVRNAEQMTTATSNMEAVQDEIDALKTQVGTGEVSTRIQEVKDALDALKKAQETKDGEQDTAIAAAKKAGDDAQADVDALELKVGTVPADKTVIGLIDEAQVAADAAQEAADEAQADATSALTQITQEVKDRQAADTALGGRIDDVVQSVADEKTRAQAKEGELKTAIDAINNETTGILAQAKTYADGKDAAIAAAKKAGDDAQKDVDALEGKVGEVPADKTVIGLIGEAKAQADQGVADAAAEATRAEGVEQGLRADLGNKTDEAAAEGSAFARIKQVKADLASEVTRAKAAEKEAKDAADAAQGDVDALEAKVGDAADTKDDATVYGAIAAEKARAEGKEAEIKAVADKNKQDIATLNGADTVKGSVANKIKIAIDQVNTAAAGLGDRVGALETKVGSDADAAKADGSLYARVKQNANEIGAIKADYLKAADKTALENAIKVEKGRLDAFMADADVSAQAVDTLKEIQSYITKDGEAAATMTTNIANNKAAIDAINNETTGILAKAKKYADDQDAAQKTALEGAIATAKTEAIDAAASAADTKVGAAKTELQGKIDKKADATALQAEIERAKGAEAANKAVLDKLDGDVNVDGSVKKQIEAVRSSLQANIDAKVAQEAYNTKVAALEAADTKLSERIAKFEGDGEGSVAAQVKAVADDLKTHKAAQATKEKAVDDKLAVIQGEANVEGSIKKALADAKSYTDTREAAINGLLGGKEDAAAVDTAFGRIAKEVARATAAEEALADRATALETKVGDSTKGLVKDVADLKTTVGNAQSGLVKDVADLKAIDAGTRLTTAETSIKDLEAWVAAHGTITNAELDAMLDKVYNQA